MCGIVVALALGKLNKKDEDIRQKMMRFFTTELMILTEDRGKDATGAAVLFNDGDFCGLKRGERSTEYLARFGETSEYYGSLLKVWRDTDAKKSAKVFLGHCRAGTTGDKEDNENNHPIKIGNLVGIHNGVIKNHEIIIKNLGCKRDGEVDSEAIFRLLEHYTNSGKEPFTLDAIQQVVTRLEGQFAVTMFNADNLSQVPFFRDGRPVEFVLIRPYGILIAVSDIKYWKETYFQYERIVNYNPDWFGKKMPSLIGDGNISIKMMEDDHAYIFDLDKEVGKDTTISDISVSKKMQRMDKMWQSTTTYNSNTYNYNRGVRQTPTTTTPTPSTDKSEKKSRVFDAIKRRYVVKIGDKIVDEDEVLLPVDKDDDATAASQDANIEDRMKDSEDEHAEKATGIEDTTDYSEPSSSENRREVYIRASGQVAGTGRKGMTDHIDAEFKVVDVEMRPIEPHMVEEAERAYRELKDKDRGYTSMDEVLTDVDIKDVEVAETLGPVILCNRVRKTSWKAGYIAAIRRQPPSKDEEKARKREKHITSLKNLLILMSKFYHSQPVQDTRQKLASVACETKIEVDVDDALSVFNSHEKGIMEAVGLVIKDAERYKVASVDENNDKE